jgi:hypothetical protein
MKVYKARLEEVDYISPTMMGALVSVQLDFLNYTMGMFSEKVYQPKSIAAWMEKSCDDVDKIIEICKRDRCNWPIQDMKAIEYYIEIVNSRIQTYRKVIFNVNHGFKF